MSSDPSDPSATSLALLHHHHHHIAQNTTQTPVAGPLVRDYRKGNWTLHETLILITAKRLDDERRAGGGSAAQVSPSSSSAVSGVGVSLRRSAEQRWKWVENYCWRNGCLRSQNQCNDKWDNLLRDYKKVRDYETRVSVAVAGELRPYWVMERHERKERNLPTNLASEVFEALSDVLGRRAARRGNNVVSAVALAVAAPVASRPPTAATMATNTLTSPATAVTSVVVEAVAEKVVIATPPPTMIDMTASAQPNISEAEPSASDDNDDDDDNVEDNNATETTTKQPDTKRRRLGSSVVRSATVLARTLIECEEKRERRHRQLLELEERRLRLEEERTEMRRQGYAGLISAVNNLSGAIHALVADHRKSNPR